MKLEEFTSEMLTEIKSLKDLTKEELPLIAQEYIFANKVSAIAGLSIAGLLLIIAAFCLYKGVYFIPSDRYDRDNSGWFISAILTGIVGFILALCNGDNLLDIILQPRRMAIKAITSLKN